MTRKRKWLLWTLALILTAACLAFVWPRGAAVPKRPYNVLLVTIDCLRADRVNSGPKSTLSPVFRRLGAQGLWCTNAFAQSDLSASSALTILTSRYVNQEVDRAASESQDTNLARILRRQGYHTAAFLASAVMRRQFDGKILESGFEELNCPTDRHRTGEEIVRQASHWMRVQPADEPWFLWAMLWDIHEANPPLGPATGRGEGTDRYDEAVRYDDMCVGKLMEALRETGQDGRTLVVATSLHGFPETALDLSSIRGLSDKVLRVPLAFWAPNLIPAGKVVDRPVMLVDVLPTVLSLLSLPAVPCAGRSVTEPLDSDREVYAETSGLAGRCLRKGRYKYVEYMRDNYVYREAEPGHIARKVLIHRAGCEFYDLEQDPQEQRNLIDQHLPAAEELRSRLEVFSDRSLYRWRGHGGPTRRYGYW